MTVVTLHELLAVRNESIRVHPSAMAVLLRRIRRISLAPARRALALVIAVIHGHALVLSGCAAFVIAAATLSATLAWAVAGAALFFLEARRR